MNRTNQSFHSGYFKQKKPVRYEKSVIGLLKRKKTCVLCKQEFPYSSYNRHFDQCSLADDDSEVEVIDQLDAEEKSRRAAANAVVLDETIDENMIPTLIFVNKDDLSTNQQPSQNAESERKSPEQSLRRSTRLSLHNRNETVCPEVSPKSTHQEATETIQRFNEQEVPPTNASQEENVEPHNESTSDFVATVVITDDIIWTTTTPRRSTRLLNSQKNDPNQLTPTRRVNESTKEKAVKREETTPKVNDGLGEGEDVALSFLEGTAKVDKLPTKRTRASALQVNEDQPSTSRALNTSIQSENASQTRVVERRKTPFGSQAIEFAHENEENPPKREKLEKFAEQIVAQIDANFANQLSGQTDMNATYDMANEDESNQSAPVINLHYTISFTLRIIRRVLSTPTSHGWCYDETFWGRDIESIKKFVFMGNSARRLLMRLFLRKRKWFTIEDVNQKHIARTQSTLLAEQANFLVDLNELIENRFVDTEDRITSLDTALNLCSLEKVRMVAKQFKIDHTKTKTETIAMLLKRSTAQRTIFGTAKIASQMLIVTKKTIGRAFRINESFDMYLKAIFTIYSPTSMNSSMLIDQPNLNLPQKLLLDMLQLENRKILLPGPNPCPGIISIYHTPLQLKNYIWTKEMEVKILGEMGNGNFVNAYEESIKATNILDSTTKTQYEMCGSIPPHLRRFTHLWVLVRCMAHGAVSLERERRYREAVIIYQRLLHDELLSLFCANERGAWWDRLALCLHSHLKENDDAIEQCRIGLQDPLIGDKDRLLLQDRLIKMTRGDFITVIQVPDPVKKLITNPVLMKDIGNGRVNQFVVKSQDKVTVVSVEEVALKHYLEEEGFTAGIHIEGGIWHMALDLLFHDIIYHHKIENVWFSELQNVPGDFNYAGFYESRKVAFDERLSWLAEASTVNIEERAIRILRANDKEHGDDLAMASIGESDLRGFLKSCTGMLLAEVCGRVIKDRRNTRSGFPDLTLWNTETRELAVVEVKGPNDKLSTKQRLWLDIFSRQGIRAEVCHVAAVRMK